MPKTTENRQAAPPSSLERLVARHPLAVFLIMLYAIAWGVFLPVGLQTRGLLALPIELTEGFAFDAVTSLASILGVALPAFLVTAATRGGVGVRDLLGRCLKWRVGLMWYLIALFGLLAVMVLVGSALSDSAPLEVLTERWSLLFTLFLPEVLIPFLTVQIFEEAGWTGFMQDTLQERAPGGEHPCGPHLHPATPAHPAHGRGRRAGLTGDRESAGDGGGVLPDRRRVALQRLRAQHSRRGPLPQRLQLSVGYWGPQVHRRTDLGTCRTLVPKGVVAVVVALSKGRLAYEPERGATTEASGEDHRV